MTGRQIQNALMWTFSCYVPTLIVIKVKLNIQDSCHHELSLNSSAHLCQAFAKQDPYLTLHVIWSFKPGLVFSFLQEEGVRRLSCMMSVWRFWCHFSRQFLPNLSTSTYKRGAKTKHFLIEKCYFSIKLIKQHIFKPKCNCWEKSMKRNRICNGCLVRIENSVTQDNCSASLVMPNRPSWRWNFQSEPHDH